MSGSSMTSVEPSTVTQTMLASASSGMPTSSGNGTVPSATQKPSQSQTGSPSGNGAGMVGVSFGVVGAAVLAMLI